MYNENEMRAIRYLAKGHGLDAANGFWHTGLRNLCRICNGCGPERWNKTARKLATGVLKIYEPAFAIHDYDYDKKRIPQKQADKRLKANMLKIWRHEFGIFRWLTARGRFNRLVVIPAAYASLAIAGSKAYNE